MTDALIGRSLGEGTVKHVGGAVRGASGHATARLGRRNDRILLGAVGGYIGVLAALMFVRGIAPTPDVLLVGLGLAAALIARGRPFFRDWIPFVALFLAYELMRDYAHAFGPAVHVVDAAALERTLWFGSIPTEVLQGLLHPASGVDRLAVVATVFYFLHFLLPLGVGIVLWLIRRRAFYDYVAALIVLSIAAFVTFLYFPVAPPWWAAAHGALAAPGGGLGVLHLKDAAFQSLARAMGFDGRNLYSYAIYGVNPNEVAAFPSLHAAYPFLAFLFARRWFGRSGYLMLVYSACVWFSVVYLGEHYVVDVVGGILYASATYWAIFHAPLWLRRMVDGAADEIGGPAAASVR